jgi:protein-tyrosine kinase
VNQNLSQFQQQPQQSMRAIPFANYIRHYVDLIFRWKWFIVITFPVVFIIAFSFVYKFLSKSPELSAKAIIGVNTGSMSAIADIGDIGKGRAELLTSRHFLYEVVQKLSLQLSVSKNFRSSVFDSVHVDSLAPIGRYVFSTLNNGNEYILTYSNKLRGIQAKIIDKGKCASLSSISTNGIFIKFTSSFLSNPNEVRFSIGSIQGVVETLLKKMTIQDANIERGSFNISVTLHGLDYPLTAQIVNCIADLFIEKNASFRKEKMGMTLATYENELSKAQQELTIAQSALKSFRYRYPTVGLTAGAQLAVNNLASIETNKYDMRGSISEAQGLLSGYTMADGDEKVRLAGEILVFLNKKSESSAPVLQSELSIAIAEQRELKRNNYDVNHPLVIENQKKMTNLQGVIGKALFNFIANIQTKNSNTEETGKQISVDLQNLPSKELQLAELQRRQQVASDIYASVLSKKNQAKVSDASDFADFFIMDYAVAPFPPPVMLIKLLGISFALGLAVALGPVVLFDMIDKTVRTEFELSRLTRRIVLESIPSITLRRKKNKKKQKKSTKSNSHDDFDEIDISDLKSIPELPDFSMESQIDYLKKNIVAVDSRPNYINEILRSLRTKLLLLLHDKPDKSIVITSLEKGAGKSTIASNLAITFARQHSKVILIDGDLRCGTLHEIFGVPQSPGLSDLLMSNEPLDLRMLASIIRKTEVPDFSIICSGNPVDIPPELLSSPRFAWIKEALSKHFNMVFFDAPPLGAVVDAIAVHNLFSGYLFIIGAGMTNVIALNKKMEEYSILDKKTLGFVLNRASMDTKMLYYKKSKYYKK